MKCSIHTLPIPGSITNLYSISKQSYLVFPKSILVTDIWPPGSLNNARAKQPLKTH